MAKTNIINLYRRYIRAYAEEQGDTVGPSNKEVNRAIKKWIKLKKKGSEKVTTFHIRVGKFIRDGKLLKDPHINRKKKVKKVVKQKYEGFYGTREWRAVRYKVIVKYDGCCMACGRSHKKDKVVIHVDHIKPRSLHPELELDIDNLQLLCEDCNLGKSNKDETDWRGEQALAKKHSLASTGCKDIDTARKKGYKSYYDDESLEKNFYQHHTNSRGAISLMAQWDVGWKMAELEDKDPEKFSQLNKGE